MSLTAADLELRHIFFFGKKGRSIKVDCNFFFKKEKNIVSRPAAS
jgi:hypothetical protein